MEIESATLFGVFFLEFFAWVIGVSSDHGEKLEWHWTTSLWTLICFVGFSLFLWLYPANVGWSAGLGWLAFAGCIAGFIFDDWVG
jgi:hypothetical protein